jgi:DNA-binding MarR family transcriptional regulator
MGKNTSVKDSTGFWVTRLARSMEQDFEQRLRALDLTRGTYAVLSAIYHDQQTTPAGLAKFLGIDAAAITRHLDRIESRSLIQREPRASDRRSIDICLTRKGTDAVRRGRSGSAATNRKFTKGLSPTEVDHLRSTMQKMLANAEKAIDDV